MKRLLVTTTLFAVLCSARGARADGGGIGIGAGWVKPKDVDSTYWLTGNIRLPLGHYVALEPEVGYWKKTETFLGVEGSLEDLNFGGSLLVVIPLSAIEVFAGGGAAAHRVKGKVGVPGFGSASETQTKTGFHVLGGVDLKLSEGFSFFGAARFDTVKLDQGSGDKLDQTKVYGGIRLRF